ncbi:MAG: hypothetical protein ACRD22_08230, partial [Terriglobia bacterium]
MNSFSSSAQVFQFQGMNLTLPVDQIPAQFAAIAVNVRQIGTGQLSTRHGFTSLAVTGLPAAPIHTIKRLNDPTSDATTPWRRLIGTGTTLYSGETAYTELDSGYSGNPLCICSASPRQSPRPWAYIADSNQMHKANSEGDLRAMGLPIALSLDPGSPIPLGAAYAIATFIIISDCTNAGNWAAQGTAGAPSTVDRFTSSSLTVVNGHAGIIVPSPPPHDFTYPAPGFSGMLCSDGTTTYRVLDFNSVSPYAAFSNPAYLGDSGASGNCTVLTAISGNQGTLHSPLIVQLDGSGSPYELAPSVVNGLNNNISVRLNTGTSARSGFTGLATFTLQPAPSGAIATLSSVAIRSTITAGTGTLTSNISGNFLPQNVPPNRYVHISVQVSDPSAISGMSLLLGDATDFSNGAYIAELAIPTSSAWTDLFIPISDFLPSSPAFVAPVIVGLQVNATATVTVAFNSLTLDTCDGPDTTPSGIPYSYRLSFRDSTTGARSQAILATLPSTALTPRNTPIAINWYIQNPAALFNADTVDIERLGGSLTDWHYVGSGAIFAPSFVDIYPDASIQANDPLDEINAPFAVVGNPINGTYLTSGTALQWESGQTVPGNIAPGTLVNVLNTDNNVVFTTNIILPPQGSANVLQVADCIVPPSG